MKPSPLFGICNEPISFSIGILDFISLEDVKKFISINKNFTLQDIKVLHYYIGTPIFVNIEESIKQNKIISYNDDEIQWFCSKDCVNCEESNI